MSEEIVEETLVFTADDGTEAELTILLSLEHEGKEYILVTDDPDAEDVEVQILRMDGEEEAEGEEESVQLFNSVDDLDELKKVSELFSGMLDDDEIDLIIED